MAIDFSTFTEAQRAAMDKWLPETEYLMDNLAMALEGADPAAVKGWYLRWGTELDNLPTYKAKLGGVKGILTNPITAPYKEGVTLAAAKWLDDNNPNILDANGKPFTLGFYKDIFSGDAATQKTNTDALDAVRKSNATDYVNKTLNAKGTLDAKTIASSIDEIINGTTAKPYTPTKLSTATSAEDLRNAGAEILCCICVINRQQGGVEALEKAGIPLISLFTMEELKASVSS